MKSTLPMNLTYLCYWDLACESSSVKTMLKPILVELTLMNITIDVYVTCMPAQFWKFDILCKESRKRMIMETGSGIFTRYWSVAEMIGQNLVTVVAE
ncbi:hypothetical protein SAMN05421739_11815 [Pontibacter chinhatensis]|uniref:Uncharacterized protein n=1 Tax=Pontibacter chinhatensis TaxID=1436961 RepID=A0A1I2ZS29_9BACT|nr:hypothetical protein SAMN05421739_11815 [Pontibacter chinhatensis]